MGPFFSDNVYGYADKLNDPVESELVLILHVYDFKYAGPDPDRNIFYQEFIMQIFYCKVLSIDINIIQ